RFLIRAYQWTLSPLLSWLGGPSTGCRFHPTCSAYFLQAVECHGGVRGSWLGLKRLARCQPWGGQGEDPVPEVKTFNVQHSTLSVQCTGNSRSVNNPAVYGPTSLDCRNALHHWPGRLAGLHGEASGACA